ncbi:MAG: type II toxin-antitoxin system HicA family toxin [candidate division KSB1 bacterium]|nr:type II toxin-antitoxin system HicA family toxin [candidate division KSB1 bacterium]MDZ7367111.1 type II toxin-antitoxin system HicA family toxin [candidate division KSB1 bacterium]MDZ7405089.1 type II toxin-antitoxin system HicA family toxin [candidate division KSB1 bacterium]
MRKAGFEFAPKRGKCSHTAMVRQRHGEPTRLVIIPKAKDLPRGTLMGILFQAGLTTEEFLNLL